MSIMWHDYIMGTLNECRSVGVAQCQYRGFLLAILSLLAAPWLLARAITGRWNLDNYKDKWVMFTIVIWICVVLIEWLIRLI